MASDPKIVVLDVAGGARQIRAAGLYAKLSDYWALTKPEVNFLILITTFAGFYLASAVGPSRLRKKYFLSSRAKRGICFSSRLPRNSRFLGQTPPFGMTSREFFRSLLVDSGSCSSLTGCWARCS